MTTNRIKMVLPLGTLTALLLGLIGAGGAWAATPPVKEILSSHFGREVNLTETDAKAGPALEDVCTVLSKDECQSGREGSISGGFANANGVAVDDDPASVEYGDAYVADSLNHRIQVLTSTGIFVLMFGKEVNATTKGDICTAASKDVCQPGVEGSTPGQFGESQKSITVDPANGDVYVTDFVKTEVGSNVLFGVRVQKFTAEGRWLLEIGKEVNTTTKGNLCTQEEIEVKSVHCTGPAQYEFSNSKGPDVEPSTNSTEPGALPIGEPLSAAVGGPEDLLYVGDGQRVQKFTPNGSYKEQILLTESVGPMAIDDSCQLQVPALSESTTPTCADFDPSYGDLYIVYSENGKVIHKLAPNGKLIDEFPSSPRIESGSFTIAALAVDSSDRLGVSKGEQVNGEFVLSGSLVDGATGHLITEFQVPGSSSELGGLAFSAGDELYGSAHDEVLSYAPVPVAELLTRPASCTPGAEDETDAMFDCALNGEVNPKGVAGTEVSFQWGSTTALGSETPAQVLCTTTCGYTPEPATFMVKGLRPNATVSYRLAAHDQNVVAPELLTSATLSSVTPAVAPRVIGEPSASFVGSSSVVLSGALNPENAPTEYFFEYASGVLGGYCEGAVRTKTLESSLYGAIGATLEVSALQPATTYQYRLCAINTNGEKAGGAQGSGSPIAAGSFQTGPAPVPQASTGAYSALGATTATISGMVDPDGQPASYAFELAVANGTATPEYTVVHSGPAGAGSTPTQQTLLLTGLQPGTTYAYRITISSGYGTATGETVLFTTAGLPSVLGVPVSPPLLAVPAIAFPTASEVATTTRTATSKCKRGKQLRHGKCVKSKRKKVKQAKKTSRSRKAKR